MTQSLIAAVQAAATAPETAVRVQDASAEQLTAARAEGRSEGLREGASAERTRVAGILDHASAKGRDGLARHFAFNTGMSVEDAAAALGAAPLAAAAEPALLREMAGAKQPNLGTGAAEAGGTTAAGADPYAAGKAEAKRLLGKA